MDIVGQFIKGYNFLAEIILQEWAVRSIMTSIMAWIGVVIIRALRYGQNPKRKDKIRKQTKRFYLPFTLIWSIIFFLKYQEEQILSREVRWLNELYWFLIYFFIAVGIHVLWVRGIAPFSDKKFNTNWLGNKDRD